MTRAPSLPTLTAPGMVLRPPRAADAAALTAILAEPAVAAWWGRWDLGRVHAEILDGEDAAPGWVVEVDGAPAGWLQFDETTDPDHPSVAFDVFLASAVHGRGLGRTALHRVVGYFAARGHHRFTIDPATGNDPAIRAYAAVGFRPVGVLRRCERGPDGRWRDGLLMDLLAEELCPPPG